MTDPSAARQWSALLAAHLGPLVATLFLGMLALALVYQVPLTHTVDIGGYDAAYAQGLYDPERSIAPGDRSYLSGSDGSVRWTGAVADLLFPQAGLPAEVTLRLRGRSGQGTNVALFLNGTRELERFHVGQAWEEHRVTIDSGLLKPNDVVIEIRAETAPLSADDPRRVGVLLDRATYRVGPTPILPYPAQLAYAALACGLSYVLLLRVRLSGRRAALRWLGAPVLLALLFFVFYRAQLPYPYPWRGLLPTIDGGLLALLVLWYGPHVVQRVPALLDVCALGGIGLWLVRVFVVAHDHVTLAIPGVEKDFRVFAIRSQDLGGVFQADGFYNLGYPFALWLMRALTADNPFLAARLLAALSGGLLLGAAWWLARRLLGRAPACLALVFLAFSPLVVAYALYLGTDMPFAALCTLTLALLFTGVPAVSLKQHARLLIVAGLVAGMAFLVRHPGILLLPFGWLVIWGGARDKLASLRDVRYAFVQFTLAFLIVITPQIIVNVAQTGQPLYNQQAKNIWLAVFGAGDWGRWGEMSNSITLRDVIAQDPGRFVANWWANVRGYLGSGAEDTSEFGHAIQLRLLGFPSNWLAIIGLGLWLGGLVKAERRTADARTHLLLLLWIGSYVLAVSVGLALPRFFVPLASIYAIAAAAALMRTPGHRVAALVAAFICVMLVWGGFATGADMVLHSQADDEIAIIHLVQSNLHVNERVLVRVPDRIAIGKYSAIAHLVVSPPASDDLPALRASGANYLLWSTALGPPPAVGAPVGAAGPYVLYRMDL